MCVCVCVCVQRVRMACMHCMCGAVALLAITFRRLCLLRVVVVVALIKSIQIDASFTNIYIYTMKQNACSSIFVVVVVVVVVVVYILQQQIVIVSRV